MEQAKTSEPRVAYNLEYATGHGTRTIKFEGEELLVHETNNFPELFQAYINRRRMEEPRDLKEIAYFAEVADPANKITDIMQLFHKREIDLFEELSRIMREREDEYENRQVVYMAQSAGGERLDLKDLLGKHASEEEQDWRAYYYSKGFDAMADIALELDPNYDIQVFCR